MKQTILSETGTEALSAEEIDVWQVGIECSRPERCFFDTYLEAFHYAISKSSHAGVQGGRSFEYEPQSRKALKLSDGRILLCAETPITVLSSAAPLLRACALEKLTEAEKEVLGLGKEAEETR